ncbi:MAG: hypothetical protein ACYC63_04875 [Armatimonadota bacterium]
MAALPTDDTLGLVIGYTNIPPTLVGADDMNRVRLLLSNLYKVLLKSINVNGVLAADPDNCVFDNATNRIEAPGAGKTIMGLVAGIPMLMDSGMERTGTVATASTTEITDTGLVEADSFWRNAYVVFTSGANAGSVRQVAGNDGTLHRLTLSSALASPPAGGDTYVVTFFYVSGLSHSVTNYIFAALGTDSVTRGIMQFSAAISDTPSPGQILISSAALNSSGVCTSVNDRPAGVARGLYPNQGSYDVLAGGAVAATLQAKDSTDMETGLPTDTVDIEITHDPLLYVGGLTLEITDGADGLLEILTHYQNDRFTVRLTNVGFVPTAFTYAWTRTGRKLQYAA